jgi:polyisoprenoid-binding protein YceI
MKKVTLSLAAGLLLVSATTFAQSWSVDKMHSSIGFGVTHLTISEIQGNFNTFDGKITDAKADFDGAKIEFTADVNSINTNVEPRDKHLKSADFFDAEKMPTIAFKSKTFKKAGGKNYKVTGDLTMHGVTKPVTFDAVYNGSTVNPMSKKTMAGFTVTGNVKRSDFGVGASMPEAMLSENVKLKANFEFSKD